MAGNGDMTYRKRCACGWVSPSLYVFGAPVLFPGRAYVFGVPGRHRGRAYVLAARAHPSWGPDGGLLAGGSAQPCRRRRTRKAANTARAARARRMPVSTSWRGQ